ncbi:SMP-30/gluconolactonase/LRE family protein [Actibacterium pelagium]|uniref:Gluconolactonase n=1 Tax=Actibacterium pelagium TaxID=2029103 RepID=A0A917ANL5_9RHOB|nr:SMP-30/gluconolactonase/LRE family protein [Actibacterium pelagium]GGE62247.1 gluconolactonase [Actibacterium pelagium]
MTSSVFDSRVCALGEGPLWHPERKQLFWFDILGKRLLSRDGATPLEWQFDEHVSAAGWVDHDTLLIASETGLYRFDIQTGDYDLVVAMEEDDPLTRSNDGRADPFGGFWIGTMGKDAEPGEGAIYRYFQGALEPLFQDITISNSICFAPDGKTAYFSDTTTGRIMKQELDDQGWPIGTAKVFVDLSSQGLNPDGSVVDSDGCLWNAQWGAGRVARYAPNGTLLETLSLPATQITCPAFGGAELTTMFATSAAHGIAEPVGSAGQTFTEAMRVKGQPEHRVLLS